MPRVSKEDLLGITGPAQGERLMHEVLAEPGMLPLEAHMVYM